MCRIVKDDRSVTLQFQSIIGIDCEDPRELLIQQVIIFEIMRYVRECDPLQNYAAERATTYTP